MLHTENIISTYSEILSHAISLPEPIRSLDIRFAQQPDGNTGRPLDENIVCRV